MFHYKSIENFLMYICAVTGSMGFYLKQLMVAAIHPEIKFSMDFGQILGALVISCITGFVPILIRKHFKPKDKKDESRS